MKAILLFALLCTATLLTGCHEVIVDHHHRSAVRVRDHDRGPRYSRGSSYYGRPGYYAPAHRRSGRVIVY